MNDEPWLHQKLAVRAINDLLTLDHTKNGPGSTLIGVDSEGRFQCRSQGWFDLDLMEPIVSESPKIGFHDKSSNNSSNNKMIADNPTDNSKDIDYIIEISILKLRRMQITGVKEERQKLMILETLHQSIARKIEAIEENQKEMIMPNRAHAFLLILEEALNKLGLSRILKFCISIPDTLDDFPRLTLPNAKKNRELLREENISLTQILY